jgi:superfamily II DNA/RNA helicase
MSFKKILPSIKEIMLNRGVEEPMLFQEKVIPKIKSGANVFAVADDGEGKTTALIISVLQKLENKAEGDNPRAIIFVKDKKEALELEEKFKIWTKYSDLRIYTVVEEHHIYNQKDLIYLGTDIVIATPKRLNKLYFQNGINLNQLKLIAIEDANFLNTSNLLTDINRISESLNRLQHLVFATHFDTKMNRMKELFMSNSITVE